MLNKILIVLIFISSISISAQDEILENYVSEGLQNNLALQQKDFSLQRSLSALDEARGMFFPSIEINARYTRADGGRTFDILVGDLVNPIHLTLNQLTGSANFPGNIPNEKVNFFRTKEHDTKISLVQPIFQPKVLFNYKIKSRLSEVQRAERDIYARQLVADIKKAYFNYLKTVEVIKVFNETEKLLIENLRVSESLFKNQMATKDRVYRAKAELSELQQQKTDAEKNEYLAASYFNFLLNRQLDEKIATRPHEYGTKSAFRDLDNIKDIALSQREEFDQLEYAIEAADYSADISKSDFLPNLSFAFDYGFQGEKYNFNSKNDYWMASLVLNWNLFNGFQDAAKVSQAKFQKKELEARRNELVKQIILEVREAHQNLLVAEKSYSAAIDRLESARKSFEIVERKYREGNAPQIEFLDARTTFTRAGVNKVVTQYDYFIKEAELERVTAAFQIEFKED
jgi:outer membrane protein